MLLSYLRTAVLYLILVCVIRLMGKRQIGEMEPSEFVVTMLVANLASIPMQDSGLPLLSGLVPILAVLGIELVLSSLSLHSTGLRRLLCGKPVILIDNGKILRENLRRTCITLDELIGHLRLKDVLDPKTVQFAILETNGDLSVFPYPQDRPATAAEADIAVSRQALPITLVADGQLLRHNLALLNKDKVWLGKILAQYGTTLEQTLLLTADQAGHICFYPRKGQL